MAQHRRRSFASQRLGVAGGGWPRLDGEEARDHLRDVASFAALQEPGSGGGVVRGLLGGGGEPLHIDPPPLCGPDRANKFIIVLLLRINYIKFVCSHVLCYLFARIM